MLAYTAMLQHGSVSDGTKPRIAEEITRIQQSVNAYNNKVVGIANRRGMSKEKVFNQIF